MAPKTISATEKTKRTKRAGALLAAQMHSDSLSAQKKRAEEKHENIGEGEEKSHANCETFESEGPGNRYD